MRVWFYVIVAAVFAWYAVTAAVAGDLLEAVADYFTYGCCIVAANGEATQWRT